MQDLRMQDLLSCLKIDVMAERSFPDSSLALLRGRCILQPDMCRANQVGESPAWVLNSIR